MSSMRIWAGIVCLALSWSQVNRADAQMLGGNSGANSLDLLLVQAPAGPQAPSTPQAPGRPADAANPAAANVFGEAAPAGTEGPGGGFAPQMMGDSLSYVIGQPANLSGNAAAVSGEGSSSSNQLGRVAAGLAVSGFKIADNESPRPQDRFYITENYFTHVNSSLNPPGTPDTRVGRQMIGAEKTFLDGNASFEIRVPFFEIHNAAGSSISDVGDITLIGKYAFINDADRIICAGLAVTLPTGPSFVNEVSLDKVNPTLIQPYVGYLIQGSDLYVHGFSSIAFAFDDSIAPVWFNDLGVGYYAYRGTGSVSAIVPTVEGHLTTPFGNAGSHALPVGVLDTFVTSLGTHVIFRDAVLTLGIEFPLTGPNPFYNEFVAQFNMRF